MSCPVVELASNATDPLRTSRFQSLDLWRGVACLLVLVHHAAFQSEADCSMPWLVVVARRMWIGVPMFFVISGYCISASADACRRRSGAASHYFLRRFRRIYPPAWIVLALTCTVVVLFDVLLTPGLFSGNGLFFRPWWLSISQWVGNLTLTETWRYHLGGDLTKCVYLGHYWTLCFEEQFYVVMGALVFLAPRHFFTGSVLVSVGTLVTAVTAHWLNVPINGFFFDGHWLLFAVGILVYHVVKYGNWPETFVATALLVGGIAWSAWDFALLLEPDKNFQQSVFVAALFGLLLLATHRFDSRVCSMAALRPLMAVGLMCYSLYLVHVPINGFLYAASLYVGIRPNEVTPLITIPVCMAASLVAARVFFLVVERRFLNTPANSVAAMPNTLQVQPS